MSITKVARLAGVSTSTVSRVVNNHPRVAPQTAAAVRQAMEQLGYTPSERRPGPKPARRPHQSANVAFLVFGTRARGATPGFAELLRGVSQGALEHGLNLSYHHLADTDQLPAQFMDQRFDGVLLHGALPGAVVGERLRRQPAVWLMGNRQRPQWGDCVMPDFYELGVRSARYLLDHRHSRLAFFNLDPEHWALRLLSLAFKATAEAAGAGVHLLEYPREASDDYWQPHSPRAVARLVERFVQLKPQPTGVCVADVLQTAMVQPALQEAGVCIGSGGVELMTCNDEEPYLVGLNPKPAAFDVRPAAIGRRAVDLLIWRMEHRHVPERIICTVEPQTHNDYRPRDPSQRATAPVRA